MIELSSGDNRFNPTKTSVRIPRITFMSDDFQGYPNNGSPILQLNDLVPPQQAQPASAKVEVATGGSRRALCIGINQYPSSPLYGCVNDARRWHGWFQQAGFQSDLLVDQDATRERILNSLKSLVGESAAGDVIGIQFSGHGTQLPDLNGDEANGDTPGFDEALVPVDYMQNGFVIDDDIAEIAKSIPNDVNVTFFFDCCHSGTATRVFLGRNIGASSEGRPRFMPATDEMIATHRRTRSTSRSITRVAEHQREILFAACKSHQVAWESDGQGDFTRNALQILEGGPGILTNVEFLNKVNVAFGASPRQNPDITCNGDYRNRILLAGQNVPKNETKDITALLSELHQIIARYSS
jgi:Caspase domain